ncbi:elongation factor P [Candidatus Poribacteria bacterium]|nr:elongation factor P [Candidatus Poribacteria bacterium]
MATVDANRLRPGMKIVVDGQIWTVTDFQHRTPGNLRAFVVCKIKNLKDGRVTEKTFRGAENTAETAEFEQHTCQFLYKDGDGYHFMDLGSYEQFSLPEEDLGLSAKFLVPDSEVVGSFWEGRPIGIELAPKVTFKVVYTIDAVRGNTANQVTKEAELENGYKLQVPSFVKTGDRIVVSTDTGAYVERA